jgi:hypothetical protein
MLVGNGPKGFGEEKSVYPTHIRNTACITAPTIESARLEIDIGRAILGKSFLANGMQKQQPYYPLASLSLQATADTYQPSTTGKPAFTWIAVHLENHE